MTNAGRKPYRDVGMEAAPPFCLFCALPRPTRPVRADDECARCASPLYPASRHRLDYSGQRMLHRVARDQRVRFAAAWPQVRVEDAEMRDLSLNGMQLTARTRLQQNQLIRIESAACRAVARVAYCRAEPAGQWTVGVEFLTVRFASASGTFVSTSA